MQKIAPPTGDRNPNSHTEAEILAALQGRTGARRFSFRYELLDAGNVYVDDITSAVLGAKVSMNWLADIKRTATFKLRETGLIDFLSDRIKPYVRIYVPPYGPKDFAEYPQGVFMLPSPTRNSDERNVLTRGIEAYDALKSFIDDKVTTRYTAAAGTVYTTAISTLLGSIPKSIAPSTKTLLTAYEADPGTSKLSIINALLGAINYESLSFDEDGVAIVQPYRDPSTRGEEYQYGADDQGLIIPNVDEEIDLFDVANKWTIVVSDPDRPALSATYTNTDPASPTSTVRRQRTIVDFRTEEDDPVADQATLDAKVQRLAFEASQVYQAIEFDTALMPIHSGNDVYRITYPALAVNAKFTEQTWSMELAAGAEMSHRARRVVTV
jgi:hypothetical protein